MVDLARRVDDDDVAFRTRVAAEGTVAEFQRWQVARHMRPPRSVPDATTQCGGSARLAMTANHAYVGGDACLVDHDRPDDHRLRSAVAVVQARRHWPSARGFPV